MTMTDIQTPVGQLVAEGPHRARVLERWGIDYCCGGKQPLALVCAKQGMDVDELLEELNACDQELAAEEETQWLDRSMSDLVDHIVATHHNFMRRELPRLSALVAKVIEAHGDRHPELRELGQVFGKLKAELELHTLKEETILFPLLKQLESAQEWLDFHCGSVANPIFVMETEHDDAGAALVRLRTLTNDYVPPADACNTYRVLLANLAELETDLHQHIHKENNILFPKARQRESQLLTSEL